MKYDITSEEDIKLVVDTFYAKINEDQALGPIFNEVASVDWSEHLPIMYRFWSSLLLGAGTYTGQPFPKHAALPNLERHHFSRWLALFNGTVRELFEGPTADHAIYRAMLIAQIFQSKLGLATPLPIVME